MFSKFYKIIKAFFLVGTIASRGDIGAPILISKDGKIIDGNSRLRIAKKLGIKNIPVVIIDSIVVYVDVDSVKESY